MKHLKTSFHDLRDLFDRSISVRYLCEILTSFDVEAPASTILAFMKEHDYDVIGVRRYGLVVGYAKKSDIMDGTLTDHLIEFLPSDLVDEEAPLIDVFTSIRHSPQLFVRVLGRVGGIVTRGDLQKAPVRMWLFGLISQIEMQLLRIIREGYPNGSWQQILSPERLKSAQKVLADRQRRNEAIDLADYLQFSDKRDIVLESNERRAALGFDSKQSGEDYLKDLEELRNNLAHAQDIITGYWPKIVDLAEKAERLLQRCEEAM